MFPFSLVPHALSYCATALVFAEIAMKSQKIYSNGGYSGDLSLAVLERSLTHSDNCYYIPNVYLHGRVCRTNLPSNTAFRGFGGPQGMWITENWLEEVADRLGMPASQMRVRCNLDF